MWLLRNWVESYSRPIRKKTPCSKKSGYLTLTSTNMGFDFEIGNSDFAVTHEIQKRPSTLGKPSIKWISIRNLTPDLLDFYFLRFSGKLKKDLSLLGGAMRLTVGYRTKKKIRARFFKRKPWGQTFSASESFFAFHFLLQNMYFKILIWIYRSKAPRTLKPFFQCSTSIRSYFRLFWIGIWLFFE